jgi:hypothetical protein
MGQICVFGQHVNISFVTSNMATRRVGLRFLGAATKSWSAHPVIKRINFEFAEGVEI